MKTFEGLRHRRLALTFAILGNGVPITLLAVHQQTVQAQDMPLFVIGAGIAIVSPVVVNLAPARQQRLILVFAVAGLIGLTLMQAGTGGVQSPYAVLLAMPMIWFGLAGSATEIKWVLILVVACCFVPMLVAPDHYERAIPQAIALTIVLCSVAGSLAALSRETDRLTRRLQADAIEDQLTGLLNRRGWEERSTQALDQRGPDVPACVVLTDLDHLKVVNDALGHDTGDEMLRQTGERLQQTFAGEAAVARLGGDEFVVLLVGSTADQVRLRVEAMRSDTSESGAFSAGIAAAQPHESLRDLMRRADLALYDAKSTGRSRTVVAEPGRRPI